jgi:hypothetical protein
MLRMPVDLLVMRQQIALAVGGPDKPAAAGVVEERLVAAPTERVVVVVSVTMEEPPVLLETSNDRAVGLLDPDAGKGLGSLSAVDPALGVDGEKEGEAKTDAALVVVLAKGRCGVNQTGTLGIGDIVGKGPSAGSRSAGPVKNGRS